MREHYLRQACGEDEALRQRVLALLRVHEEDSRFLASADADPGRTVDRPASRPEAPTQVGAYKLLQVIGEGGMGTVWMAEQSHPVQRKVAVKIIKPGMNS